VKSLPLADETHARAVALQERHNCASDSLVSLALDAFELLAAVASTEDVSEGVPHNLRLWERRFHAVREGAHYIEVAG
jgi:hypothetical protein